MNGETFIDFTVRLKSYFEHWQDTESIHRNYDALVDLMLREQLTFSASHNLQIWIREHQPSSVHSLVSLAEAYQLAHKETEMKRVPYRFPNRPNFTKPSNDQTGIELQKQTTMSEPSSFFNKQAQSSGKRQCFLCDSTEHLIAKCPFKIKDTQKETGSKQPQGQASNLLYSPTKEEFKGKKVKIPFAVKIHTDESVLDNGLNLAKGSVNGKPVSVLRDTGATTIFVSESVVNREHVSMNKKEVTLANGEVQMCPEVKIHIECPYITGTVDSLVLKTHLLKLL